ncbi:MAG: Fe-S cluster assembly protein SufD [Balneolaceae bacterium]|nr:Fe-S cluster assembly protein SufD [Balneolaceae bacterium]
MSKTLQDLRDNFLINHLGRQDLDGRSALLDGLRRKGAEDVRSTPFPQPKDEDWRFISLRDLYRDEYVHASQVEAEPGDFSGHYLPECEGSRLVFVNGRYAPERSSVEALPGDVTAGSLAELAGSHPAVEEHLNRYGNFESDAFSSFNSAYADDGAFIHVAEGVEAGPPVQLLFVQTDADRPYFTTPRILVVAEEDADLTLVEDHIGLAGNKYFSLPVVEINLERRAMVRHTKLQRESREAIHVARTAAHVRSHSNYESYTVTLGARLSRNEPRITQLEEDVKFTVDGLVLIDGEQVSDTHSVMDHRFPTAQSHQLHKCVINDKAHSVFNGKIFVRQHAQKIDSFQENRNLLLSRKGLVNTKPQLEIFADDVVCTHGATVGQLEDDEVFYLKSRGLTDKQARELLTYAFALETIENISVESVQKLLVEEVHAYTDRQLDSELVA